MKKGKYLILVVILAIYFLIFYFIYGRDSIAKSKKNGTLIIDNNAIWQVENGNWRNISYASEIEGLSWQEYKICILLAGRALTNNIIICRCCKICHSKNTA